MLEFHESRLGHFKIEPAAMCDHLPSSNTDINTFYSVFQRKFLDIAKRIAEKNIDKAQSIPDKQEARSKL